jgi:hypothetical protein
MRGPLFQSSKRQVPRHPYRDTLILYGSLTGILVVVTAATGRYQALIVVVVVFVAASVYSCWYWRDRLRERDEDERR